MKRQSKDQTTSGTFFIPLALQSSSWFRDIQAQRNGSQRSQHKTTEFRHMLSFRDILCLWDKWGQWEFWALQKEIGKVLEVNQGTRVNIVTICGFNSPDCDKLWRCSDKAGLVPAVEQCIDKYTRSVCKCEQRLLGFMNTEWEHHGGSGVAFLMSISNENAVSHKRKLTHGMMHRPKEILLAKKVQSIF